MRAPIFIALAFALGVAACSDPAETGCTSATDCADGELCRSGACVTPPACARDSDCPTDVCQGGLCRPLPCQQAADCVSPDRLCVAGACAPGNACQGDDDCPGTRCDLESGRCTLPAASCGDGGVCPAGERCVADRCLPAEACADDAACPDDAFCDAGRCRTGCRLTEGACPAGTRCHPEARVCQGCAADTDCADAEYCSPDGCLPGCRPDGTGCAADEACDPMTHTCRCAADAACPDGTYCGEDGACAPGCRADGAGCAEGLACDPATHACRCPDDAACPADQYCDTTCQPGCRVGGCPQGQICDVETRACRAPGMRCDRDLDCPAAEYCADGGCAPGCREGGCDQGQICDPANRLCLCNADAGCPQGSWCDAGTCTPGCRADGAGCASGRCDAASHRCHCDGDGQCVAGDFCDAGLCTPGCRLAPDDCEVGRCDPATHQCQAGACARDADCPNDQACLLVVVDGAPLLRCGPALANGRAEAPCDVDVQCASRLCTNAGYCFSACERDADCPSRRCATIRITVDQGDPVEFQSCAPPEIPCAADVDCPMDQACAPAGDDPAQPARPLLRCVPRGDDLPGGAPCAAGNACASGVCLDGACWQPCAVGGAGHCPAGQGCYPNQFFFIDDRGTPGQPADDRYWGMAACIPAQGSDAACPDGRCAGGEVCTLRPNATREAYDQICRTPLGAAGGGGVCRTDADCQSGLCFNNGICLGLCDPRNPAGQCVAGTACAGVTVPVQERDPANPADDLTDELNACFP